LEARILAVADAYEAMTSDRSYRSSMPNTVASAELERCAGTQFDACVVQALLALLEREGGRAEAALERV
jgi:HD-GYP domain-containing protein (c-di-GMP phosphodiesterase class II)